MLAAVTIGVFGLFHPVQFELRAAAGNVLVVKSAAGEQIVEGARVVRIRSASAATGRDGAAAHFILSIPGKIRREYYGKLEIRADGDHLAAVVEMDRETAVASIVGAELPGATPLEAFKAQAIVARSFLAAAGRRHGSFDFCDTTHCQFLRESPPEGSAARLAQESTKSLVITYQGRPVPALYSANCGGRTRTLEDAGWQPQPYPFFAVDCPIRGGVRGHRIGMCQEGAAEMARRGATFSAILARYFPATSIATVP
jgi:peptidoglycan hydrolase-like amidase